jgi:hypothetical protein
MVRHILWFLAAFAGGAILALGVRSALHRHEPVPAADAVPTPVAHVEPAAHAAPSPASPAAPLAPAPAPRATVNSICALCGMDVDPSLPPAEWRGNLIGFGCAACPPRFARDPDRYGPAALENRVAAN